MTHEQPMCMGTGCTQPYPLFQPFPQDNCFYSDNGLTNDEIEVLNNLAKSWQAFVALAGKSGDDVAEFRDGIHRCQQLIALRVARRVNPMIWRVPE